VANADSTTLNAEQIMFVKRRTEPRAHAPSKVFYTAKVNPPSLIYDKSVHYIVYFSFSAKVLPQSKV